MCTSREWCTNESLPTSEGISNQATVWSSCWKRWGTQGKSCSVSCVCVCVFGGGVAAIVYITSKWLMRYRAGSSAEKLIAAVMEAQELEIMYQLAILVTLFCRNDCFPKRRRCRECARTCTCQRTYLNWTNDVMVRLVSFYCDTYPEFCFCSKIVEKKSSCLNMDHKWKMVNGLLIPANWSSCQTCGFLLVQFCQATAFGIL